MTPFRALQSKRKSQTDINDEDPCMLNGTDKKKCKRQNIIKYATWNIQSISYKDEQLHDILVKKNIGIATITETEQKLTGSKETIIYFQFYGGAGQHVQKHKQALH
jgi:hypothetical protein